MSRNPSISLTDHQQRFVAELVASGRYHGVSEVLRAGLRLLEDQEVQRKTMLDKIGQEVEIGLSSGAATPMENMGDIIAEAQRQSERD